MLSVKSTKKLIRPKMCRLSLNQLAFQELVGLNNLNLCLWLALAGQQANSLLDKLWLELPLLFPQRMEIATVK